MEPLESVDLDRVRRAQLNLQGIAVRTPLVRLNLERAPAEIYLKLENLQPIGSFKVRGAGNAIASAPPDKLRAGVITASAGNMAQGVAWSARRLGLPCTVVVPDHAPRTKLDAIERLGASIVKVPFDDWWQIMLQGSYPEAEGLFIHPVSDAAVIAGNGTIGLEVVEDLPLVDTVIVPYGGGGLSSGISIAVKAVRPEARILASEVETAAPFTASWKAGEAQSVDYVPSFVDGIGGKSVLPNMWPLTSRLLDGSIAVSLRAIADAIRLLVERNRVVAEGAGASSVAAALTGSAGGGTVVCIVSGGNLDRAILARILQGEVP